MPCRSCVQGMCPHAVLVSKACARMPLTISTAYARMPLTISTAYARMPLTIPTACARMPPRFPAACSHMPGAGPQACSHMPGGVLPSCGDMPHAGLPSCGGRPHVGCFRNSVPRMLAVFRIRCPACWLFSEFSAPRMHATNTPPLTRHAHHKCSWPLTVVLVEDVSRPVSVFTSLRLV